jgi:DNA adenine methylase
LFFSLLPKRAIINDANEELINAYVVIRDHVEELIESLLKHKNDRSYYYRIRALDPKSLDPIERASRFLYLNRACYNGLYRENSKGEFSVPFGNYKNIDFDFENLRLVSEYLRSSDVVILNKDYKEACKSVKAEDFVFLDPPYYLEGKGFTRYTRYDFTEKDHAELAEVFKELDKRGAFLLLTNSDTDYIRKLYKGYNIVSLKTNRFINSNPYLRKAMGKEVIITNYHHEVFKG